MLKIQRRKPGIHLRLPAIAPVVAVPAGLAALTTEEERLSCKINNLKEALAKLGEEYSEKQDKRVAARRRGDIKLAESLVGEMQDIVQSMAAIQHHVQGLDKQREQLGRPSHIYKKIIKYS